VKERTETTYECEVCEELYGHKEDCESCERSCKILRAVAATNGVLEEAVDGLNKIERMNMANALIQAVKDYAPECTH